MNRIELLAPAGSLPILKAAVDSGADAVYCGVNLYNARINADNLTMDDLMEGCVYAHRRSTKGYLTLNTLINDEELPEATELAANAYNLGVDAILVQDIGLARSIKSKYPEIPLHASTQMNVYSTDDSKTLSEMGFTRVVLPRELTLDEIRTSVRIASQYDIDLEVFAHGAVCVCYSGLCLFSSMNKSGTRSGNRGLCAQPCRQEYKLIGNGNTVRSGHLLSPKDRCVIPYLSELSGSDESLHCIRYICEPGPHGLGKIEVSVFCKLLESLGLGGFHGERLFKKNALSELQSLSADLEVAFVGHGDVDRIDIGSVDGIPD